MDFCEVTFDFSERFFIVASPHDNIDVLYITFVLAIFWYISLRNIADDGEYS